MQKVFYWLQKYVRVVPLSALMKITDKKSIFPFYHLISDEDVIHIKHLYHIRSEKDFKSDLDFFTKEYEPIDVKDYIINTKSCPPKRPGFLLSFDDGLRQFYDIVSPILLKKGISAICFLNSKFVDNKDLFYRYKASILFDRLTTAKISTGLKTHLKQFFSVRGVKVRENYRFLFSIKYSNKEYLDDLAKVLEVDFQEYLLKNKPYLETKQIEKLIHKGFLFGSHSIDHPEYFELPLDQQLNQTTQSIDDITSRFRLNYKLFSFPFTDYGVSNEFFDLVYAKKTLDLSFGCAGLKKDECKKNIQRIPMEINKFTAKEIIYGEYWYYLLKSIFNKNTIRRS